MAPAEILINAELPGLELYDRGKVRDVFRAGPDILVVATDRLYLFDRLYPGGIPGKGRALTELTRWGFHLSAAIIGNYLLADRWEEFPSELKPFRAVLEGRSLLVRRVEPIRVECVVRGYLYGRAWAAYQRDGRVGEVRLPPGLARADELPEPLFTPSRKNRSGPDEDLSWNDLTAFLGAKPAARLRGVSLEIYRVLRREWYRRGVILADTKFEFGLHGRKLLLINEVSTPDCSRFWPVETYRPGRTQKSLDKDLLENYLRERGAGPDSPPVPIPAGLRGRLGGIYRRLAALAAESPP